MAIDLFIAEIHGAGYHTRGNRFRVVQKVWTVDGPRDRFTDSSFPTKAEAEEYILKKKVQYANRSQ